MVRLGLLDGFRGVNVRNRIRVVSIQEDDELNIILQICQDIKNRLNDNMEDVNIIIDLVNDLKEKK